MIKEKGTIFTVRETIKKDLSPITFTEKDKMATFGEGEGLPGSFEKEPSNLVIMDGIFLYVHEVSTKEFSTTRLFEKFKWLVQVVCCEQIRVATKKNPHRRCIKRQCLAEQ